MSEHDSLMHPGLQLNELCPTEGTQAAAVATMREWIAIVFSCIGDEEEMRQLEIEHGGEGEHEWWGGLLRQGMLLTCGICRVGEKWCTDFTINFDTDMNDPGRIVQFLLRRWNGEHELLMHYGEGTDLSKQETERIHELIEEIGFTTDSHMESNPKRPQFSYRSPGPVRACAIVAHATDWFLDLE